jgi:hypothetical protein
MKTPLYVVSICDRRDFEREGSINELSPENNAIHKFSRTLLLSVVVSARVEVPVI